MGKVEVKKTNLDAKIEKIPRHNKNVLKAAL